MTRRPDDLLLGEGAPDVLVRGRVARIIAGPLADMVNEKLDKSSRPDRAVDPDVLVTVEALRIAAERYRRHCAQIAASGKAERADAEMPAALPYEDEIGIGEAADLLGCSERNARYLAPSIPGARKVGGGWVFDRLDVVEYVEARRSA